MLSPYLHRQNFESVTSRVSFKVILITTAECIPKCTRDTHYINPSTILVPLAIARSVRSSRSEKKKVKDDRRFQRFQKRGTRASRGSPLPDSLRLQPATSVLGLFICRRNRLPRNRQQRRCACSHKMPDDFRKFPRRCCAAYRLHGLKVSSPPLKISVTGQ